MRYAIFLRGINVGGIKVPMTGLEEYLKQLPVDNVSTYLQTGNITLNSEQSINELKAAIEMLLSDKFNYEAHCLIYEETEIKELVTGYPFVSVENRHDYVILCKQKQIITELMAHKSDLDKNLEQIDKASSAIYWQVIKGNTTDSQFAKYLAKPKFKAYTTNRNLNTLKKMLS